MKTLSTLFIATAFLFQSCGNGIEKTTTEVEAETEIIDKQMEVADTNNIKIPNGYAELMKSPASGKVMGRLLFDFDNDSENDIATIVQHQSEFSAYKLLIFLTTSKKQYEVDLYSTNGFSVYPVPLETSGNMLEFGYFEDGTAAFGRFLKLRYNAKLEKIQVIGYDCGYRASPSEHVDKSYNLLTGKYIVKRTSYEESDKGKTVEFSGKNEYFKNNVFIEDLNLEMIINLDDVGSKYE